MDRSPDHRMFWRLWLRAMTVKRAQGVLATASLLAGAAILSMLLNLYTDVGRAMANEFSAYGANVVLAPEGAGVPSGLAPHRVHADFDGGQALGEASQPLLVHEQLMNADVLKRLEPLRLRVKGLLVVPRFDVIARTARASAGQGTSESLEVVAVGTDLTKVRQLNPGWQIEGQPHLHDPRACAVGTRLATRLGARLGDTITLQLMMDGMGSLPDGQRARGDDPAHEVSISGIITSGAAEDNQIFLSLATLQAWAEAGLASPDDGTSDDQEFRVATGIGEPLARAAEASLLRASSKTPLSLVELYVPGDTAQINGVVAELKRAVAGSGVEVRPVRRIIYSQGRVLGTVRGIAVSLSLLIFVIIALCVMATMSAIVLERRKDVAVMKSLGAGNRQIMLLFVAEGVTMGLLAGVAGCLAGSLLASELGQRLFNISLHWTWWAWPLVCAATITLAVVATFVSVRSVRSVQPAAVLRGA